MRSETSVSNSPFQDHQFCAKTDFSCHFGYDQFPEDNIFKDLHGEQHSSNFSLFVSRYNSGATMSDKNEISKYRMTYIYIYATANDTGQID